MTEEKRPLEGFADPAEIWKESCAKFKSVYVTNCRHASGNEYHRLYSAWKRGPAATLAR